MTMTPTPFGQGFGMHPGGFVTTSPPEGFVRLLGNGTATSGKTITLTITHDTTPGDWVFVAHWATRTYPPSGAVITDSKGNVWTQTLVPTPLTNHSCIRGLAWTHNGNRLRAGDTISWKRTVTPGTWRPSTPGLTTALEYRGVTTVGSGSFSPSCTLVHKHTLHITGRRLIIVVFGKADSLATTPPTITTAAPFTQRVIHTTAVTTPHGYWILGVADYIAPVAGMYTSTWTPTGVLSLNSFTLM